MQTPKPPFSNIGLAAAKRATGFLRCDHWPRKPGTRWLVSRNAGTGRWASARRLLAMIAAVLVALAFGCDRAKDLSLDNKPIASTSAKILTANVFRIELDEDVVETAVFFGKLKPNRQSRLGFGRGGRVKNVFKQLGDQALTGEKLAELDQADLDNQKKDLEQAIADAKSAPSSIVSDQAAQQQQKIDQLESSLKEIEFQLSSGIIVAPYDCLVAERNVEAGSLVSPQLAAFDVVENVNPLAETDLPNLIANGLAIGQSVWIIIGSTTAQAKIRAISPLESPAGTREILLQLISKLDEVSWAFGQTVEIRFFVPTDDSGYWVPLSALNRESSGLWSVLVVEDDSAVKAGSTAESGSANKGHSPVGRKMVELVQLEDNWALVRGALTDRMPVIVNGSHRVVPGQRVEANDVTDQFTRPNAGGADE